DPYQDSPSGKSYSYKVLTYGSNHIPLPLPHLYRPILPPELAQKGIKLENSGGEYKLQFKGSIPQQVDLRLLKQVLKEDENSEKIIRNFNTIPSSIDKTKWPPELLDMIDVIE